MDVTSEYPAERKACKEARTTNSTEQSIMSNQQDWEEGGGGGGSGQSIKFYKGRLRPKVQTFTLLYTIFDRKGTPFVYLP